jgi:predicted DNA-binding transcriptional regulator AlpA
MRREDLLELPPVIDVPTAGRILGVGRSCAYELVRSGQWPTPVLHLGRLIRIPTAPLIELVSSPQSAQLRVGAGSATG